jgi:uncharacterized membrane protein
MRYISFTLFLILSSFCGCSPDKAPEYPQVIADGDYVRLQLSEVNDGEVHFYTYKHADKNVNFLVRTDGKGKLHTHLDACYSCFQYKRGYFVEDADLVCWACRYRYALADEVWEFIQACTPITLKNSTKRGQLLIKVSRLQRAGKFF